MRLVKQERSRGQLFEIDVCVFSAGGKGGSKVALDIGFAETVVAEEESIFRHVSNWMLRADQQLPTISLSHKPCAARFARAARAGSVWARVSDPGDRKSVV